MISFKRVMLLFFVLRARPRAEVLSRAAALALDEQDVDALAADGLLDLRHDDAGAPYLSASEDARGKLLALLGGVAVGAATIADAVIAIVKS